MESVNNPSDVQFRKKLRTSYPGGEISNGGQRISVRSGGGVEATEITTGSPGTIRFRDHGTIPAFSILTKLRLGGG